MDVRFLNPQQAGIAFHAASLHIAGRTDVYPTLRQPALRTPPGIYEMPVIRIEFLPDTSFSETQRDLTARMVVELAQVTRARAIQVDFDAPRRALPFYRELMQQVRARLGRDVWISMTALVSWCGDDSWLTGMDVDEIVPMMFRMGTTSAAVSHARCRGSVGVSTQESVVPVDPAQRVYLFPDHQRWSPVTLAAAFRRFGL